VSDEAFADIVNGLVHGPRRHKSTVDSGMDPPLVPIWPMSTVDDLPDDDQLAAGIGPDAAIVRPYSWTRGRTRSPVELRIEALVTTTERGDDREAVTQAEHRSVAELCREPRSVAEVATLLGVPLGVAKVLLGDMANLGLVVVHKTATGGANKAHLLLMERVLSGLRRL
jgi:hypothetical protein